MHLQRNKSFSGQDDPFSEDEKWEGPANISPDVVKNQHKAISLEIL